MSDDKWELVTDGEYVPQPGVDQLRFRYVDENAQWTEFGKWGGFLERRSINAWRGVSGLRQYEFRRPRQSAETTQPQSEPEQPATTAGSKYKRTICQTLPDGRTGATVIVDIYDVLRAWNVHCPAIQHAIKKLLQPGQRGSKSAVQDLREAIGSIDRAIQLMGGEQ